MTGALAPVRMLLLAIFVLMSGGGGLATLTAVRLEATGVSTGMIGLVATAYFAGLMVGSLLVFRIIARVGHIRAFAAFVSTLSAIALVYAVHVSALPWAAARLVEGFCMAGVFICLESWLAERSETSSRGAVLGAYMIALYSGQALSQFLLAAGGPASFLPFVGASILLSLSVIPIALTRSEQPVLPDVAAFGLSRLYNASPLGMAGCLASGLVLGAFYGIGPVFALAAGLEASATALFMSAAIAGGVVLQLPLGRLSDAIDRRKVVLATFAAVAAVSAFIAATDPRGALLFVSAALFGGTTFALYPLCVAHTNDHLRDEERTGASAGLVLAYSAGAAAGPLAAAAAMGAAGAAGLFLFTGGCAAALFLFASWRLMARPPVPAERQRGFLALPRTTPAASPLDPLSPPR